MPAACRLPFRSAQLVFQHTAGAEARRLGCSDHDLGARLGIDAFALLALAHLKRTETGQCNLLAARQCFGDHFQRSVQDLFGRSL